MNKCRLLIIWGIVLGPLTYGYTGQQPKGEY